jgi:hypothetical protein
MLRIIWVSLQFVKLSEFGLDGRQKIQYVSSKVMSKERTSIAGSQGSFDWGGIPQSSTPGIGGGRRRARRRDSSSWGSSETACWLDEVSISMGEPEKRRIPSGLGVASSTISSDMCARGWFLRAAGGRRIITWDFGSRRAAAC